MPVRTHSALFAVDFCEYVGYPYKKYKSPTHIYIINNLFYFVNLLPK